MARLPLVCALLALVAFGGCIGNTSTPAPPPADVDPTDPFRLAADDTVVLRPEGHGWQIARFQAANGTELHVRLSHDTIALCDFGHNGDAYTGDGHTAMAFYPGIGHERDGVMFSWWGTPYHGFWPQFSFDWDCGQPGTIELAPGASAILVFATSVDGYTITVSSAPRPSSGTTPTPWPLESHPGHVFDQPVADDRAVHSDETVEVMRTRQWSTEIDSVASFVAVSGWTYQSGPDASAYAGIDSLSVSMSGSGSGLSSTETPLPFVERGPTSSGHRSTASAISSGKVSMAVTYDETSAGNMAHDSGAVFVAIPLRES